MKAKKTAKKLDGLTKSRKKGLKSNSKHPKFKGAPGPEYGHGKSPARAPKKIW